MVLKGTKPRAWLSVFLVIARADTTNNEASVVFRLTGEEVAVLGTPEELGGSTARRLPFSRPFPVNENEVMQMTSEADASRIETGDRPCTREWTR